MSWIKRTACVIALLVTTVAVFFTLPVAAEEITGTYDEPQVIVLDTVYTGATNAYFEFAPNETDMYTMTFISGSAWCGLYDSDWNLLVEAADGKAVKYKLEEGKTYYFNIINQYSYNAVLRVTHEWDDNRCTYCGAPIGGKFAEDLIWSFEEGTLNISGTGNMGYGSNLFFPWDELRGEISKVIIEEGVTEIGEQAFEGCVNLTDVTIPESVESLRQKAFSGCTSLKSVIIPGNIRYIQDNAFGGCSDLTEVVLSEGVRTIGEGAFSKCVGLTKVELPDSLDAIYEGAFDGCTGLQEVVFGIGVPPYIWGDFFTDVTAKAYYPAGISSWGEGVLQDYGGMITWVPYEWELTGICGDDIDWAIRNGVLSITGTGKMYDYWFEDETGWGSTAPWQKYKWLFNVIEMSDDITYIGSGAFYYLMDTEIQLPKNLVAIGDHAFYYFSRLYEEKYKDLEIVIPEGTEEIGEYAFYNIDIKSISFPSTIETIGEGAFTEAFIDEIHIPSVEFWCELDYDDIHSHPIEVKSKSVGLYVNGELIEDLVIPYGVTKIHNLAFYGYGSLKTIQIPDSVTNVGSSAFCAYRLNWNKDECMLREVIFPASVESIGWDALSFNENLEKIVILNPDCELPIGYEDEDGYYVHGLYQANSENKPIVYGFSGSTAEACAKADDLEFIALEEYEIIEGADSTVKKGDTLAVRVNADFSKFTSIAVDGLTVDPENYTVSEEGLIIIFKAEHIDTLDAREHSITVFLTDGIAYTSMTVTDCVSGDISGDGKTNNKDVTRLLQYLSGWDVEVAEAALDVNGDGKINNKDATRLLQYLSNWDVEIY